MTATLACYVMHNRVKEMRAAGYSYAEIGHALDILIETVWDILHDEDEERDERPQNILSCAMHLADLEREHGFQGRRYGYRGPGYWT